jgi:effector-binding domain-containing protein
LRINSSKKFNGLFYQRQNKKNLTAIYYCHTVVTPPRFLCTVIIKKTKKMETKKIEKTLVAAHRFKTSLAKIQEAVGVKPNQIMEELTKQGIEPSGPQIWHYTDCDGQKDTEFTLDICVPVVKKGADTDFITFKELDAFNCATQVLHGPWDGLEKAYYQLFEEIGKAKKTPTGTTREVYLNCDFENQSKCITEIQAEIQ